MAMFGTNAIGNRKGNMENGIVVGDNLGLSIGIGVDSKIFGKTDNRISFAIIVPLLSETSKSYISYPFPQNPSYNINYTDKYLPVTVSLGFRLSNPKKSSLFNF